MNPVYCRDCDNVEANTRKLPTWRWLCTRIKKRPTSAIAPELLDAIDGPYERCSAVNAFNNCGLFEPLKEGDNEVQ